MGTSGIWSGEAVAVTLEIVLAGGGHAHVEVLRRLASLDQTGLRLTVVSPDRFAAYSGMLPGLVAGHYSWDDCHIDLAGLCRRARARLVAGTVARLDPQARVIVLDDGSAVPFDLLSLNTGSTPDLRSTPGAEPFATPVKPMREFLTAWDRVLAAGAAKELPPPAMAVVGAGAGGVEIALALHHRLSTLGESGLQLTLAGERFLDGYPASVQRGARRAIGRAGIRLVDKVKAAAVTRTQLSLSDGQQIASDFTVWAVGASAPPWIAASGLAVDHRGFLAVDEFLKSRSHDRIFAAGDAASLDPAVPKAGVYAVRQGPVLAHNLLASARGETLDAYRPQPRFLSLISLGGRRALASWGPFKAEGAAIWRLKDHIDRKFMRRYRSGPPGASSESPE